MIIMRNKIIYLLIFCFLYISCYSQPNNRKDIILSKKEFSDSIKLLNNQITKLKRGINELDTNNKSKISILMQMIDSIKKSINDNRLRESINLAESTITNLNSITGSFSIIYSIITIAIILLTIGLPFIIQQLSIKPMKDEINADHLKMSSELEKINGLDILIKERQFDLEKNVNSSIQKFNSEKELMLADLKKEFDSKFIEYLNKNKKDIIDQAIINLNSDELEFQSNAINYIALTPIGDFTEEHLFKISKILKEQKLDLEKSKTLSRKLVDIKSFYSMDFFSHLPYLEKINSKDTRLDGYNFYSSSGISNYENEFVALMLSEDATQDYIDIIDWFRSTYKNEILLIINFKNLNREGIINVKLVYEKLKQWYYFEKFKMKLINLYYITNIKN